MMNGGGGQKKRNPKIEPFRHRVETDPKFFDKSWRKLHDAIREIYNHNASGLSFEELYRTAYNMVLNKFAPQLYEKLTENMKEHLEEMRTCIEAAQGGLFLEEMQRKWNDHNKALTMIRDILMYMDRTYIPTNKKTPVFDHGLELWRDTIVRSPTIQGRLSDTLLNLIHLERTGEVINRGLMRTTTKMLMDLGLSVYQDDFETPFLEVSASFYSGEAQQYIESCACGEYLKQAERRLSEESERVSQYLDVKTNEKITAVVVKEMLANHMQRLILMENSGLVNMLLEDRYEDLTRMYTLFNHVPDGLTTIRSVMASHIKDTGKSLVTDPERLKDPVDFVQRLLNMKDKYDNIINVSFSNDKSFLNALNSSFEHFINLNNRSPEALPEDHKGDGEEDAAAPLEDHGYSGEEDSADGDQDDRGPASEYSDDDIVPFGQRAVQLLAIRANFHVCAINGYDWQVGRCIYREHEREVQVEGMVDLIPIGPRGVLMAYGAFTLENFHSMTRAANNTTSNEGSTPITFSGAPLRVEWDVCGEDDDIEPEEYTQTIYCRGPDRKLEITYLVIPNAIKTNVEVKLKLKDLGSRSRAVYGKIKASTADYGNKSVHLFSCERARSWSVPSGPTSILPLSPAVIALPYRRQLELHIEVDLIVIIIFDNQEEYKNLKFSLTFSREIRSQEIEVDDDQVEVSIAFYPKI